MKKPKDPKVFVGHILECIDFIEQYTKGKTQKDFLKDTKLQDAIVRRVEIIGEAIRNISDAVKKEYPVIPWKNITGMRDKLIHDYFGVDLVLTWEVVVEDIPDLKKKILKVQSQLEKEK